MNIYKTTMVALIAVAISPIALAQVYKCDGPDGPVYTDQECAPGAEKMEFAETSGVSGVSDQTKADLAEKKAERERDRSYGSRSNSSNNTPITNSQNQAPVGNYWQRRRIRPSDSKPVNLPVQRPVQRPVTPRRK